MNILGVSYGYHDAAAALIVDGEIVAASQEERFSRKKNDPSYPANAIAFCLAEAGLAASDLDKIAYYETPIRKFDRIFKWCLANGEEGLAELDAVFDRWLIAQKFEVREQICAHLGVSPDFVTYGDHHRSHAASAFFTSPFDEALVVTLDGVGEHETATLSHGRGTEITKLASVSFPNSIGLFYSTITSWLGFEVNEGEYKVMGLAAFGRPTLAPAMREMIRLKQDGTFDIEQKMFDFRPSAERQFSQDLLDWLGPARTPDSVMELIGPDGTQRIDPESTRFADIAASLQRCTEDVVLHVVERGMAQTGLEDVCLAGGVGLNSVVNGRIQRELGARLYVQPAAGDAGGALGAALAEHHCDHRRPRTQRRFSAALGKAYTDADIDKALQRTSGLRWNLHASDGQLVSETAKTLHDGKTVGWFQGRTEWGPRALGHRSILADPTKPDMKFIVNDRIKFREQFRPFAPSVLAEHALDYFELDTLPTPSSPEAYMLSVCRVRPDKIARVPAVTHVDCTARIHVVYREANPLFYDLIAAFHALSGVPILLNTSFNRRGEPIVASPEQAIATFQWCGLDRLAIGRHSVSKTNVLSALKRRQR